MKTVGPRWQVVVLHDWHILLVLADLIVATILSLLHVSLSQSRYEELVLTGPPIMISISIASYYNWISGGIGVVVCLASPWLGQSSLPHSTFSFSFSYDCVFTCLGDPVDGRMDHSHFFHLGHFHCSTSLFTASLHLSLGSSLQIIHSLYKMGDTVGGDLHRDSF